jgi:hypothetical protein
MTLAWLLLPTGALAQAEPDTGAEAESATEPESGSAPETESESEIESEPASAPAPESEPESASAPESAPEPATESAPEPEPESASESESESEPEPESESEPESAFDSDDLIVDSELASILADTGDDAAPDLRVYGFIDFTYQDLLMSGDSPFYLFFEENGSFWIGNLNLYLDGKISERFRTLAEVRFLYLPNGASDSLTPQDAPRTDTSSADYADVNRDLRWGGVEIERVWLDYFVNDFLTLRVGQYLTPYGIWNVDHGSPVVVGTRRPYIVGQQLFPERQTGLQGYGTFIAGGFTVGYNLTVSNGRGPSDAYRDLDENKGVGGRVHVTNASLGRLTLGLSAYTGSYTDRTDEARLTTSMEVARIANIRRQYDETSLGADVKWEYEGLLVQGEVLHNQRAYTEDGRPVVQPDAVLGPSQLSLQPDRDAYGAYGLLGYRIAALRLMPYVYGEYVDLGGGQLLPDIATWQAGLNFQPEAAVVIKAQFTHAWSPGSRAVFEGKDITAIESQVAWAF